MRRRDKSTEYTELRRKNEKVFFQIGSKKPEEF